MTIAFRPLKRDDFPLLGRWLAAPHVEPWWREAFDPDSIESRYGPSVDGHESTEHFLVVRDDRTVGLVQRYLIDDNPAWKLALEPASVPHPSAGIDYLIGEEELIGGGLGPAMLEQFLEDTWHRYPHAVAIVADVAQPNRRSWRALEKCGFQRTWAGTIVSADPSDEGPAFVYVLRRP